MALALLIIGVFFNIFVAVLVSLNYQDKAARSLLFVAFGLILWEIANFAADQNGDYTLFWNRLAFTGPLVIMLASYYFIIYLRSLEYSRILRIFIFLGTLSLIAICMTPLIVTEVSVRDGFTTGFNPVYGPGYTLYVGWILFLIASFIRYTFKSVKKETKQQKMQIRIIKVGAIAAIAVPLVTNLILPFILKSSLTSQLVPITSIIYMSALSIAIIRHRMLDIRLAAVRTAAYAMSLSVLAAIYYLLAFIVSTTLFQGQVSEAISISPVNITLALILAFIFQPVKNFFDKATDSIFYRDRYNSEEFFARLSEVLTTTTDLRNLLQRASNEIGATLKAEQAFFFVQYNHTHHVSAGTHRHTNLPLADAHRLNEYVRKEGSDVIVSELLPENHEIHRMLISHKIAVMMPIMRGKTILGYLALGEQRSGGYTNRDIKVLKTISDELVIAIQNSLSVQEVKDINVSLQQRIESATAELRTSNSQLRHLDKTKDEFLSMASHQLRTPLTSVKGYLSMVLEGDAGKVTDMQKQLLSEAFTSSERMVHLIHDFLNVSRLQTGKFMLELHPYDLAKLVEEEVKSLQRAAEVRNMKLQYSNDAGELMLSIDENKIRQVVMNFIDNALYYSHPDSTISITLSVRGDNVELRVVDTGIGVPKGEQSQLFSKFYRASNARMQRPDGTGVGIFLAKKVITEHGGDVLFESVEGKGSTFGFWLPVKKLSLEKELKQLDDKDNNNGTNTTTDR